VTAPHGRCFHKALILRSLRYWIGSNRVRLADRLLERRAPSRPHGGEPKALAAGLFSFPMHGATAGDLIACDMVCSWLEDAGLKFDVALASPFTGGCDWRAVDPGQYSHVVWICGPISKDTDAFARLRRRFGRERRRWIGINLSMTEPIEAWNPFDVLLERDSNRTARADLAFRSEGGSTPAIGLVQVERFAPLFPVRDRQEDARAAARRLAYARPAAVVEIDTRLDVENASGLRTPAEIETLIARMDLVVTTRLHGLVLALKNGVPAVAIDPVAGGDKITAQARAVDWPCAFAVDEASDERLNQALAFALSEDGRARAHASAKRGTHTVEALREQFIEALALEPTRTGGRPTA
jgi:Polysaccharide pyruvyl transferase